MSCSLFVCLRPRDDRKAQSTTIYRFTITRPISSVPPPSHKMCVDFAGKESSTQISVLKRGYFLSRKATLIIAKPITGRRHQIRLHLASIHHPIISDYLYEQDGGYEYSNTFRTFLHAWKIHVKLEEKYGGDLVLCTDFPFEGLVRNKPWQGHEDFRWPLLQEFHPKT